MPFFIIIVMCFSFLISLGIIYLMNDKKLDDNTWGASFFVGILLGIMNCTWISSVSYEDINAKLLSQNKISAQFEVDFSRLWGLIHNTKIENIEKFTTDAKNDKLKYNDRYFIIMKLAGKDVSKYADVVNDTVIYRMTPLQEMEGK